MSGPALNVYLLKQDRTFGKIRKVQFLVLKSAMPLDFIILGKQFMDINCCVLDFQNDKCTLTMSLRSKSGVLQTDQQMLLGDKSGVAEDADMSSHVCVENAFRSTLVCFSHWNWPRLLNKESIGKDTDGSECVQEFQSGVAASEDELRHELQNELTLSGKLRNRSDDSLIPISMQNNVGRMIAERVNEYDLNLEHPGHKFEFSTNCVLKNQGPLQKLLHSFDSCFSRSKTDIGTFVGYEIEL